MMTEEQYKEAESYWDKKDAQEKQMDREVLCREINNFLFTHRVLALASGSGSSIRCTPLEYTWHNGALWIFTEGGKKFRGLRENKNVSAAVFESNAAFGHLKSAQVQGTAEIVELFSEEYTVEAAFRKIPLDTLKKLPEPMWLLKIIPDEIVFLNSDFKKEGFGARQTWRRIESI